MCSVAAAALQQCNGTRTEIDSSSMKMSSTQKPQHNTRWAVTKKGCRGCTQGFGGRHAGLPQQQQSKGFSSRASSTTTDVTQGLVGHPSRETGRWSCQAASPAVLSIHITMGVLAVHQGKEFRSRQPERAWLGLAAAIPYYRMPGPQSHHRAHTLADNLECRDTRHSEITFSGQCSRQQIHMAVSNDAHAEHVHMHLWGTCHGGG